MKKVFEKSIGAGIVLCLINFLWLGYNTYKYLFVSEWFEAQEIYVMLIFIGLLMLFFSHIALILLIVFSLNRQSNTFRSGIALLITGAISFIALFFHWGGLTDVLKEYPAGLEVNNELKAIWVSHILHLFFILYSLTYLIRFIKVKQQVKPSSSLIGEQLFVSFNLIGIVCGITGLLIVTVDFFFRENPQSIKWAIIPSSLFIFIPYLLVLFVWLIRALNDKQSGWHDEKQKFDIYKSSTFTLLVSIPLMFSLFLFNYNNVSGIVSVLWLPFYLFVVLSLFSVSSLYNFKSN